jgi:ATP-dependent Clp protease ATP-binding subunit ClpA
MGARPLSRKRDELIRVPLSKRILFEKIKNANILATLNKDMIEFVVTNKVSAKVNENGIIEIS